MHICFIVSGNIDLGLLIGLWLCHMEFVKKLEEGLYEVELVTEFKKGEMLIGSCDVLGSSK